MDYKNVWQEFQGIEHRIREKQEKRKQGIFGFVKGWLPTEPITLSYVNLVLLVYSTFEIVLM